MAGTITREELKAKIDRGDRFKLVEALGPEYFKHSHLPGAVNIPFNEAPELAPKFLPDKGEEIVTYCMNPN